MSAMPLVPNMPIRSRLQGAALLCLTLMLGVAQAQPAATPRQLIDNLGLDVRHLLQTPDLKRTPEAAERDVAEHIKALIRTTPGHPSLTAIDSRGRTPLMLAAGHGYALIVETLLSDPSVRLTVDVADADGETAWMLASFALPITLPACQPGNLTVERQNLMAPYLRRMTHVARTGFTAVYATVAALEAAGAQRRPDEAKRAWLTRCPNTDTDLHGALAEGELTPALIKAAVTRQNEYARATRAARPKVAQRPPKDMRFIPEGQTRDTFQLVSQLAREPGLCRVLPKPQLQDELAWDGQIVLRAIVSTRGGVVEAVDVERLSINGDRQEAVTHYFRHVVLNALAGYECEGDFVFEQEFHFAVR